MEICLNVNMIRETNHRDPLTLFCLMCCGDSSVPKLWSTVGAAHWLPRSVPFPALKPVPSSSVLAWKVNGQRFVITFENVLSTYCVQDVLLGAVGNAELKSPGARLHEHHSSCRTDVRVGSKAQPEHRLWKDWLLRIRGSIIAFFSLSGSSWSLASRWCTGANDAVDHHWLSAFESQVLYQAFNKVSFTYSFEGSFTVSFDEETSLERWSNFSKVLQPQKAALELETISTCWYGLTLTLEYLPSFEVTPAQRSGKGVLPKRAQSQSKEPSQLPTWPSLPTVEWYWNSPRGRQLHVPLFSGAKSFLSISNSYHVTLSTLRIFQGGHWCCRKLACWWICEMLIFAPDFLVCKMETLISAFSFLIWRASQTYCLCSLGFSQMALRHNAAFHLVDLSQQREYMCLATLLWQLGPMGCVDNSLEGLFIWTIVNFN